MDQGPLAKAEGLRQSVSPSPPLGDSFPHADRTPSRVGHTTVCYSLPSSGKAESLYARLGCSMDRPRSCARLQAAPGIWIRRLKSDEGSRLFRYALAEPFCATECSAVSRACRLGWKVGRYISLHSSTPGHVPLTAFDSSLLIQCPASATRSASVAAIHHGSDIRPQR